MERGDSEDSEDEYAEKNKEEDGDESESEGSEDEGEVESEPELEPSSEDEDDEHNAPRTPSRKRKTTTAFSTPRRTKRTKTIAAPTPHSKAALRARAIRAKHRTIPAPPPELALEVQQLNLPEDPWLRAMQVLHVGSRPDVLPCREKEFEMILRSVEALLEEGSGGCVCEFFLYC